MAHHEIKHINQPQQLSRRAWLKHTIQIVSEVALGDVATADKMIQKSQDANLRHLPQVAVDQQRSIVGRPVDVLHRSVPVDLEAWRAEGKVGEYHRSESGDTVAYTEIQEKGRERLPEAVTVAFTSMPRKKMLESFGEPQTPAQNNELADAA
jgi:hypothetical protein